MKADGSANRITVLETKGDHLDTDYKRKVLGLLSNNFALDDCTPAGDFERVRQDGETVQSALVPMSEWKTKLPEFLDLN